ncbi:nSTAND1 domain-containing NTPase [Bradyrhizobium sp. USDA 4454]
MSRIFLSHSSKNNAEAAALRDWLAGEGWDDIFFDADSERGIATGERWERALNQAASRCEAVLFLVSRAWLDSDWCLKEFNLAYRLNKRLFGVLIEEIPLADLPANLRSTWQSVQLSAGRDHIMLRTTLPVSGQEAHVTFSAEGLTRLKNGLQRAGLDPRFFAWPPEHDLDRPPYRGLSPLEAEDAGIFFGRDAKIVEVLDRLRGLRDAASPRLLVILGASGAGKSSFLRAGVLPRLQRDDRSFLPLPVVRPQRAAITGETGLLRALEGALRASGVPLPRAEIRAAIDSGPSAVCGLLRSAQGAAASRVLHEPSERPPVVVLPIDQGEELFLAEGFEEADNLIRLCRHLLFAAAPDILMLIAIRSDSYEQLQNARHLEGIAPIIVDLPPMPRGAYQTVIEGPAARMRDSAHVLTIDPALTQALLVDIESGGGRDALPLLSFTMERLFLEYGVGGRLTLADYDALGRIKGSIEAAVERAMATADNDAKIPRDRRVRLALLRRGFIPWLAGIDHDTNSPRRRVARLFEIPEEARPLIDLLKEQHLLATDVARDTGQVTIEPAHEALLRQWGLLQGWLEEDSAALTTLDGVRRAARDWAANAKDPVWLNHSGGRLEDAEHYTQRADFAHYAASTEIDYIAACRQRENAERKAEQVRLARERRNLRRARRALTVAFVAVMAILAGAMWESYQTSQREAAVFASAAGKAFEQGFCDRALRLAEAGLPASKGASPLAFRSGELQVDLSYFGATFCFFQLALSGHAHSVTSAVFSPDGSRVLTASDDNTARLWDAKTGATLATLSGHTGIVHSAAFSRDGARIVTASADNTARLWDGKTGAALAMLLGHTDSVVGAAFSPDGLRIVTASHDHTARLWNGKTGEPLATLSGHSGPVRSAAFDPDGSRVVTASSDATARLWDGKTGKMLATLSGQATPSAQGILVNYSLIMAVFSPDGSRIVTASDGGTACLSDGKTGEPLATLSERGERMNSAAFSPDGSRIVTASYDHTARLWNGKTGELLATLSGHTGRVISAVFSPDGSRIVTASDDHTARLWDIDPLVLISDDQRQNYVCRQRLIGVQSFTDMEMLQDPILRGRDDLRNPCDRVGPLNFGYYWRAAASLVTTFSRAFRSMTTTAQEVRQH